MGDFKIIFIHGYTASHLADWYPNISKELDALGIDYAIPDLPGGKKPHSKEWLQVIDREVKRSNKPVVLVGHSLGTRAALLYLDQYKQPAKAVFLIAAFANRVENAERRDRSYADFFEYKISIGAVKKLCDQLIVIHATDDNSIDIEQGKDIAEDLDAKLITVDGRGHLYKPSNASFILEQLRRELGF